MHSGSAEDSKRTNHSIVEIVSNDHLHKHRKKNSRLVTYSEWMAPKVLPWPFAYPASTHIFSDITRMDICPILRTRVE